jgi:hypothetical protein
MKKVEKLKQKIGTGTFIICGRELYEFFMEKENRSVPRQNRRPHDTSH